MARRRCRWLPRRRSTCRRWCPVLPFLWTFSSTWCLLRREVLPRLPTDGLFHGVDADAMTFCELVIADDALAMKGTSLNNQGVCQLAVVAVFSARRSAL